MNRWQRSCLSAVSFVVILLKAGLCQAQFSANFQTNTISGVASNWSGDYIIGSPSINPFADVLLVQNGGVFTDAGFSHYGFLLGSSNNAALVTDPGSTLFLVSVGQANIGFGGIGDSVIISNGGKMVTSNPQFDMLVDGSQGTSLLVSDPGSVLSNGVPLYVGYIGAGNSLMIRNGGLLVNNGSPSSILYVGRMPGSSNNNILVSDPGSVWTNAFNTLAGIGLGGNNNSLMIRNGGKVFDRNITVGVDATAFGNIAQVDGA